MAKFSKLGDRVEITPTENPPYRWSSDFGT